jgi:hypothetical protein
MKRDVLTPCAKLGIDERQLLTTSRHMRTNPISLAIGPADDLRIERVHRSPFSYQEDDEWEEVHADLA